VNISNDSYADFVNITSLAWYHNGTRFVPGNKFDITSNGCGLRINNMTKADAGTFQVKIDSVYSAYSIFFNSDDHFLCDTLVLPLLESTAIFAPVTFILQQSCLPEYDPSSVISEVYLTEDPVTSLMNSVQNISLLTPLNGFTYWYRNGIRLSDVRVYNYNTDLEGVSPTYSLHIEANKTQFDYISGSYVGIIETSSNSLSHECPNYNYLLDLSLSIMYFPVATSYWKIKLKGQQI